MCVHFKEKEKRVISKPSLQRWELYQVASTKGILQLFEFGDRPSAPDRACVFKDRPDASLKNFLQICLPDLMLQTSQKAKFLGTTLEDTVNVITPA